MEKKKKQSEYSKLLLDPKWQKKRLEILERDEWACQLCWNDEETLHVHHKVYEYGNKPWEYENHLLITLCASCHEVESHNHKQSQKRLLKALAYRGFLSEQLDRISEALESLDSFKGVNEPGADEIAFAIKSYECQSLFWEDLHRQIELSKQKNGGRVKSAKN